MKRNLAIIFLFLSATLFGQQQFRITRLKINSDLFSEMAPVIYKNGIVFSSNMPNSLVSVSVDENNTSPYNLFFSKKKGRNWSNPEPFAKNVRSYLNESSACFSSESDVMYFTQSHNANLRLSQLEKKDSIKNGIFLAAESGKEWAILSQFEHNDEDYNYSFPNMSSDGTQLFLCSDMAGGYGGYDLYVSTYQNGKWQKPVNLGNTINTPANEVFPFYHKNGRLFFSSKGHHGRNDLDIYYSEKIDDNWIKPVELPRPFNLNRRDDFGYVLSPMMDTGFFVSNRRGSDDIYMFASSFPAFESCPEQLDETFCYEFSETGSLDLDTTSLKYEWDFGDGGKERNIIAEHCYSETGTYIVSLNVIDTLTGDIYFSEASYELIVEPAEQPYITAPDTAFTKEPIQLTGADSFIQSFTPTKYYWDMGDGNSHDGMEIVHTYTSAGTYYLRLGITEDIDESDSENIDFTKRACSQRQIVIIRKSE